MNRDQQESKIVSSLLLQILLYFNRWFVGLFVVLNLATFIYKGYYLPYPTRTPGIGIDVASVVLFGILEGFRIFTDRSNKTEQTTPLGVGICLGLGSIDGGVLSRLANIRLKNDVILNDQHCFIGLELILSVMAMIMFQSANF